MPPLQPPGAPSPPDPATSFGNPGILDQTLSREREPLAAVKELAVGLSEAMVDIHRRGWCDGTGGNFSCTLSHKPLRLLMAPSGMNKGSVSPDDLIIVDESGRVIHGNGRASAETKLHQTIVRACQAGAVLHTHSQAGTLLSDHHAPAPDQEVGYVAIRQLEMLKGLEGIHTHDTSVRIPVLGNDQDLDRLSATAVPHLADAPHGLLIAGHGLYAWGSTLPIAQRHLEILEFLLEQKWRQLLLEFVRMASRR